MEERTTQELIEKLGDDVDRCHAGLVQCIDDGEAAGDGSVTVDYEYHARQLIRSILAYVEGVTFSVKVSAVARCLDSGIEVSDHERYLAVEIDGQLNDKGEVIERPAKLRLAENVRFAFRLLEKATQGAFRFDPSVEWWASLRGTIAVRDRLTHPRYPQDIDVSGEEIVNALKAKVGFETALTSYKQRKPKLRNP
ncbi:MAG: hypothetical protein ABSH21_01775 [Verrucomicrobiia bacterium]